MSDDEIIIIGEDEEENKQDEITLDELLSYADTKEQLDEFKKSEMDLRKSIGARVKQICLRDNLNTITDKKFTLDTSEFTITYKQGLNRNFDDELLDEEYDDLTPAEKSCFKKVWKLIEAEFKKLQEEVSSENYTGEKDLVIFDIVTEKPGAPDLSIKLK